MRLTRRDALAVLAGAGILGGSGGAVLSRRAGRDDRAARTARTDRDTVDGRGGPGDLDRILDTLVAVAEVVYPSAVTGIAPFVETYAVGRLTTGQQPDQHQDADRNTLLDPARYRAGVSEAIRTLDEYAQERHGTCYADLDPETRDVVLRRMGVDVADPDPDGVDPNRVRFYVVNDLQYALYTSPTGGRLVGIENPQGHPGGTASYRRGPE